MQSWDAMAVSSVTVVADHAKPKPLHGQTEIHFGKHYQEQGCFDRLMTRIRAIGWQADVYLPVIPVPLRA